MERNTLSNCTEQDDATTPSTATTDSLDGISQDRIAPIRPITTEVDYNGQPRRYRLQHGDHFDTLNNHNPWTWQDEDGNTLDWYDQWVWEGCESESFEKILTRPRTAEYIHKLANLKRENLVEFVTSWEYPTYIPLFKDPDTGDEYHIDLGGSPAIPRLICPSVSSTGIPSASPLFLMNHRGAPITAAQALQKEQSRKPPRYVIQLGCLKVTTTTFRGLQLRLGPDQAPEPTTERTDWNVILDAEDERLSVWIVASRQQLKDHILDDHVFDGGQDEPILPLPIFKSLMADTKVDYDCACILDSVHRLGLDNPEAPLFSEVLETIRGSRCILDPTMTSLPEEQFKRYGKNEPFSHSEPVAWPADPNLEVKITRLLPHER